MTRLVLIAGLVAAASPARAQPTAKIGVDAPIGEAIPGDIALRHPGGEPVTLGAFFDRPVVLVLAYVRCPMLCDLVLRGLAATVRELGRTDFELITVSLDPGERASEAAAKQRQLLELIDHPGEPDRWRYLLGHEPEIKRLAAALGYRYRWDPKTEQFAHPAVIFVLGPRGRLSSALVGPEPTPAELAEAVDDAAAGRAGGSIATSVLSCFRFDPALRRYRDRIQIYFQIGALLVFLLLAGTVGGLLWRDLKRRRR